MGFLTFYLNCERDESIIKESPDVNSSNQQFTPIIKSVSLTDVNEKFNRLKNQYELDGFLQSSFDATTFSRSSIDTLGVTI